MPTRLAARASGAKGRRCAGGAHRGGDLAVEEPSGEFLKDLGWPNRPESRHPCRYDLLGLQPTSLRVPRSARLDVRRQHSAAGRRVIHTDFEHGFIRAEYLVRDFVRYREKRGARAGKLQREGKEYVVREGDVMHFLQCLRTAQLVWRSDTQYIATS